MDERQLPHWGFTPKCWKISCSLTAPSASAERISPSVIALQMQTYIRRAPFHLLLYQIVIMRSNINFDLIVESALRASKGLNFTFFCEIVPRIPMGDMIHARQ